MGLPGPGAWAATGGSAVDLSGSRMQVDRSESNCRGSTLRVLPSKLPVQPSSSWEAAAAAAAAAPAATRGGEAKRTKEGSIAVSMRC